MEKDYSFIFDERMGQYRSRRHAADEAKRLTAKTGVAHWIKLTTTYRDLAPRICWAVCVKSGMTTF